MTTPSNEFEDFLRHLTYDERTLADLTAAVRETTAPGSPDWNPALKAAFCGAARLIGMRPLTAEERDRFMAIPEPEIIEALNLYRGALELEDQRKADILARMEELAAPYGEGTQQTIMGRMPDAVVGEYLELDRRFWSESLDPTVVDIRSIGLRPGAEPGILRIGIDPDGDTAA